tara:strand:+ start:24741 stop:26510 length:1770 start_codon:yes stop_codon:yes gene_type:complete
MNAFKPAFRPAIRPAITSIFGVYGGGLNPITPLNRFLLGMSGNNIISTPSEIAVLAGQSISVYVRNLDTSAPRCFQSGTTTPRTYGYIASGNVFCPEAYKITVDDFETNVLPSDGNIHKITTYFNKTVYLNRFGLSHTNIFGFNGDIAGITMPSGETFDLTDNAATLVGSVGSTMALTGGTWKPAVFTGDQWTVAAVDFFKINYNVLNEYLMHPVCGQSNGAGSTNVVSTAAYYLGQAFRYLTGNNPPFVIQKEYLTETVSTAMASEVIKTARGNGFSSNQVFHVAENHAVGGRNYAAIKKGGTEPLAYAKFITELTAINAVKPVTIKAFHLVHGEADLVDPWIAYRDNLIQFLTDYTTDYKSITGKTNDPVMFVSQISSQQVYQTAANVNLMLSPLALLDVCRVSPKHYSVGPQYWCETNKGTDYYHLSGRDQVISGEYRTKAYHKVVTLNNPNAVTATIPLSATVIGNTVEVVFDVPLPPLKFDTSGYIPAIANNGFVYSDSAGRTITSVAISGNDKLIITLSGIAGANPDLQYAYANGTNGINGTDGGPRGTLCDSDESTSIRYPTYVMRNYSLAFRFGAGYLPFS